MVRRPVGLAPVVYLFPIVPVHPCSAHCCVALPRPRPPPPLSLFLSLLPLLVLSVVQAGPRPTCYYPEGFYTAARSPWGSGGQPGGGGMA